MKKIVLILFTLSSLMLLLIGCSSLDASKSSILRESTWAVIDQKMLFIYIGSREKMRD